MKKLMGILLIICCYGQCSWAVFAPRAMGMGGAFTAIADDAFAAYWNPAGIALNPGIDLAASYQMNNRNNQVGDNSFALKGCFELRMSPFTWLVGVGAASVLAMEGAKYLSDQGVVKTNWNREIPARERGESMAEQVKEADEEQIAQGKEVLRQAISKKEAAKKAAKEIMKGTMQVSEALMDTAVVEAQRQTRYYLYAPAWYRPDYYRPTYWDYRYGYDERELTPAGKAQFGGAVTVMSDKNNILDQDTNWYAFTLASGWGEIAALGANINIYDLKIPSLNVKGLGAGLDLGGLLRISNALMFGLTAQELLTTDIKWENGAITRYQMNVNAGVAIVPLREITLAADLHNIFGQNGQNPTTHFGIEAKPAYGIALRAGLADNNKTAGASIGIGQLILDYAYLGGNFNRTQMLGATWKI